MPILIFIIYIVFNIEKNLYIKLLEHFLGIFFVLIYVKILDFLLDTNNVSLNQYKNNNNNNNISPKPNCQSKSKEI